MTNHPPYTSYHLYGNHSPGPRPNYYAYPHPAHVPAQQYQHPQTQRGAHRGIHVNGSYNPRATQHYHHTYHPPPHQPPYPHPHMSSPLSPHPPLPQLPGQHVAYPPQSAKFNPAYQYLPSPTTPAYSPSWQSQPPISPLPKQLSMPPPQNVRQFYDPSRSPQVQISPATSSPAVAPLVQPVVEDVPPPSLPPPTTVVSTTAVEPTVEAAAPLTPEPEPISPVAESSPAVPTSSYSHIGTIHTAESQPHSTSPTLPTNPIPQWVIWSRRPHNPSQAPGIIISSDARPPPNVVEKALDLKTPPASRPPTPPPPSSEPVVTSAPLDDATITWSSQTDSAVPSSAATELTNTPTIPGSPVSSHTSISVTGTPAKEFPENPTRSSEIAEVSLPTSVLASFATGPSVTHPTSETAAAPTPAAECTTTVKSTRPETPSSSSDIAVPPQVSKPVDTSAPSPAAVVPKKSWASLLRPSSEESPGSSRNTLPTSSVVGFSIPAATVGTSVPVSISHKSELLNLLTTGPLSAVTGYSAAAAASGGSASKIKPRGLVNSGNMCFANSVLQILLYCPPFHKLFSELGKLLVDNSTGKDDAATSNGKTAASSTPLVWATSLFLQEFMDANERKKISSKKVDGGRSGINGSSGSGLRGKGKEREFKDESQEVDDWDGESFLPSYVYDAMKTKKRFDTMRGGHQEDAEEFFGFYLDTLEEELLLILHSISPSRQSKGSATASVEEKEEAAPPEDAGWFEVGRRNRTVVTRTIKATESPITRIFGGKFRSVLRASGQKDSVIVEDWRSLRLDIQRDQIHTIQEALSYISHPQPVQVTQSSKPGVVIEAQQQILIEALPPILVLHIKRFYYDTTVGGVVKVGKHVQYGPELEIRSDVMVPALKKAQPTRYKLIGALYHHGNSAAGGHYTLDVLHPNRYPTTNAKAREGWVRIDDELVSDVRLDDVFRMPEQDDTRCAYLLFYRRIV